MDDRSDPHRPPGSMAAMLLRMILDPTPPVGEGSREPTPPGHDDPPPTEVLVRAAPGTPWGVLTALLDAAPPAAVTTHGTRIGPDSPLGVPPLVDGVRLHPAPAPPAPATSTQTAHATDTLQVHVVAGPDAGRVVDLPPGRTVVGRGRRADAVVDDPTLSRRHAALHRHHDGVRVEDLGSTNGTDITSPENTRTQQPARDATNTPNAVDDIDIDRRLRPGQWLNIGDSVLTLADTSTPRASLHPTGSGTIAVNRRPRTDDAVPTNIVDVPVEPVAPEHPPLSLITLVVPLVVSVVAAVALSNPMFLVFGLLSPVMTLTQHLSQRRGRRRAHAAKTLRYQEALHHTALAADRARRHEIARRHARDPDLARVRHIAVDRLEPLWERRAGDPDQLRVRLGRGQLRADCGVRTADGTELHPDLDDVPVTVDLRQAGVLGVTGEPAAAAALAASIVGQLAVWTSPADVSIWVLTSDALHLDRWRWATALPHCLGDDERAFTRCGALTLDPDRLRARVDDLLHLLRTRRDHPDQAQDHTHLVVLDDAERLRRVPGVPELLTDGPRAGIHALCVADRQASLPVECRTTVHLTDRTLTLSGSGEPVAHRPRPDLPTASWGDALGGALAPLRDIRASAHDGVLPSALPLTDLLDVDAGDPAALAAAWNDVPRTTNAPIGAGPDGTFRLDLTRDGPHLLVGGMTGSGKSELLRTLVTTFAVANRPDELGFVLVDYKGGAAFDACARLPHVLGLVTDLDASLTVRALLSLRAELRTREETLRERGVETYEEYAARRDDDPRLRPMPRLVIVVDEFRALAEEHPDFVSGLVRIATQGRSLGVHLVLATQRPAGVVSAEIRANANLRIALRVRDRTDSYDVIETDDAAALPAHTPGRALLRTGGGDLVEVQVAHVGPAAATATWTPTVRACDLQSLGAPPPPIGTQAHRAPGTGTPNPLEAIVAAAARARDLAGVPPVPAPWLPPLPDVVSHDDIRTAHVDDCGIRPQHGSDTTACADCSRATSVTYGLVDDPGRQRRAALTFAIGTGTGTGGNLALVGAARSGRTQALRSLAAALAATTCPGAVYVHVVDAARGLDDLADAHRRGTFPHLGTHVGIREPGRLTRLFGRLLHEVRRREAEPGPSRRPHPDVVLLLDGFERIRDALDDIDHGAAMRDLTDILRAGPSVGVRTVLAGDRALLLSATSALVEDKLVLHLTDPTDALLAGIPAGQAPPAVPGRARRVGDGLEVQIAALTMPVTAPVWRDCPGGAPQGAAHEPKERDRRAARLTLAPLPARVSLDDAPPAAVDGWDARDNVATRGGVDTAPLGLLADDLTWYHAPLDRPWLVTGPARSGRTRALETLLAGTRADTVVRIVPGSPPSGSESTTSIHVDPSDAPGLRHALRRPGRTVVVADDAERWFDSPVEDVLTDLVRTRSDTLVLVAAALGDVRDRFRGLTAELRRNGQGLVLTPTSPHRDLFSIPLPVGEPAHPGRGVIVSRGRTHIVQVATS